MISVADRAMRKALAANGYPTTDGAIAVSELAAVTALSWSEDGFGEHDPAGWERVADLTALAHAPGLTELDFGGNRVASLEPLRGHAALEELWVQGNDLRDASVIGTLPKLRVADLDSNRQLTTLGDLRGATELARLNLNYTGVRDFESLLEVESLRDLSIYGIAIEPHEPAFEVLVRLSERVAITADRPLLDLIKAEAGRRSIADNGDEVVGDLAKAGLQALAAQWSQGANSLDERGATVLHLLAGHRDVDDATRATLTRRLVAAGGALDVVQRDFPNSAPLGVAVAENCSPEYAQLLIDLGADPSYPPSSPPLSQLRDGADQLLRVLLDAGADVTQPRALLALVTAGDAELLARAGATANLNVAVDMQTPLIAAVTMQRDDLVQALLDAGADPNFGVRGQLPLHNVRTLSTYELLVKAGANPRATTANLGKTTLHSYTQLPDRSLGNAEALLRRAVADGVDPGATDVRHMTALHALAERYAYGDAVEQLIALVPVLLELGVDPRALDEEGNTARNVANDSKLKKALTAAKVPTGAAVLKQLDKALRTPGAADWDAAKRLAHVNYGEALAPYRELVAAALEDLDGELPGVAGFNPTSRFAAFLLADGATAVTPSGESTVRLALEGRTRGVAADAGLIRALVAAGANPHAIAGDGGSALGLYTAFGGPWDIDLIKLLLTPETVNAPRNRSPLANVALDTGRTEGDPGNTVIDLLIEAGADLTGPETLMALCSLGRVELLKLAREQGADLFAELHGKSLLNAATEADSLEVIAYLLQAGVSANSGNPGSRAIHRVRSVEAFDLLREAGADLADPDPYGGATALHSLARAYQLPADVLNALVQRFEANGVLRTTANTYGETPQYLLDQRTDL